MEVSPEFSFKEIKLRGGEKGPHKDGWGVGFYQDTSCNIIKEEKPAYNSYKAKDIEERKINLRSKIFISHIRQASSGRNSFFNTHPFKRTLLGKDWIFAHNGTVGHYNLKDGIFTEKLVHFQPEGQTDSEYAFCFVLDRVKEKCSESSGVSQISVTIEEAANCIKGHGNFNFLLSDSEYLYAFGDSSLYFTLRKHEHKILTLEDADYKIDVSDMKNPAEKAAIIATKRLTKEENWKKI